LSFFSVIKKEAFFDFGKNIMHALKLGVLQSINIYNPHDDKNTAFYHFILTQIMPVKIRRVIVQYHQRPKKLNFL
jgi:hypothetical protein